MIESDNKNSTAAVHIFITDTYKISLYKGQIVNYGY